jgi:two-component system cell cycle sensor histidine kinase/response regulator CckA
VICKRKPSVLRLYAVFGLLAATILLLTAVAEGSRDGHSVQTPASNAFLQSLTEKEQAWLYDHPVIRVVQDPGWAPVEFNDTRGEPSGMAEDYLNLIERRLGAKFERVRNLSWQEAYTRLKRREIDMTTSVAVTPERAEFWAFTKPYMKIPIVIVTHADVTYIADMRELAGKKIAVVDGYAVNDWIPRDFPEIRLVRVKTAQEGLESLQRGDVFAYIENMLVVGYYMAKLKMTALKIAGETPYVNAQCMAVRKDWAILAGILEKALDSITETERNDIYRKWLPIRYEHGFNYTLFWQMLAVFAMILLGLVLWIRRLTREIRHRKKAEATSRENARRFRRLFDVAAVPLALVDKDGVLTDLNDRFVQAFGYTREEVPTLAEWRKLAYPDPDYRCWVVETWDASVQRARENNTDIEPIEYRVTCKNGQIRILVITGTFLDDDLLAAFFDITERKAAEKALKEGENNYRLLADNVNDVIFVLDMNLNYTYVSPSVKILRGYEPEEVLKQPAIETVTRTSRDLAVRTLSEVMELEKSEQREISISRTLQMEMTRKDGTTVWTEVKFSFIRDEDLRPVGILGVTRDISERKRVDEVMRDSEERHRIIFEASSDAVLLRSADIIIDANPAALKLFRANHPEDLMGKRYLDLVHPDDRALSAERIKKNIDENWIASPREHRILALDGQVVYVESTGVPVKYRGETQVLGVFRDITDRKRTEEEKVKLQDQLLQSQKMESVGRLAGGVAHDFNNMLGVILGHAEMALEEADQCQPLLANLMEIRKAAERSADLTRQLLAFARKQTISPRVLDMNETVAGMLKMLQRLIGEDIHLAWLPGVKLWSVKIDPSQIDQILANLSVNARDAIAGVGKVAIETGNVRFDEDYCADHAGCVPGEYVMLAMSDDGSGMDKEVLSKLFEPFFTTKEIGKGTGLGLATVYGIVKQNNGFINVYSEPDQGTTFRIYLPRHRGKAEQAQTEGFQEPVIGGQETVLVVEDEPALLDMSKLILEKHGYRVLTAGTPGEATRLAEEYTGEIHLLMTDVVMPEMNGRDLAKIMLSLYPNLKRLFMSGYTANVIAHHGVLDDGVHFLQKPFSRKELAVKVREALDQK